MPVAKLSAMQMYCYSEVSSLGSLRAVTEWATRRRRAEKATDQQLQRVPSARTIARLMTIARNHLSKADTVTIAAIESGVPTLVEARDQLDVNRRGMMTPV